MKNTLIISLLLSSLSLLAVASEQQPEAINSAEKKYQAIDLDQFIVNERPATDGTRTILSPYGISLEARVKSLPEKREISYLYTALELMQIQPLPEINHRMFIESDGGKIIPVYVEDALVNKINSRVKLEQKAGFLAYHVYNYSKGPAIVIEGLK